MVHHGQSWSPLSLQPCVPFSLGRLRPGSSEAPRGLQATLPFHAPLKALILFSKAANTLQDRGRLYVVQIHLVDSTWCHKKCQATLCARLPFRSTLLDICVETTACGALLGRLSSLHPTQAPLSWVLAPPFGTPPFRANASALRLDPTSWTLTNFTSSHPFSTSKSSLVESLSRPWTLYCVLFSSKNSYYLSMLHHLDTQCCLVASTNQLGQLRVF